MNEYGWSLLADTTKFKKFEYKFAVPNRQMFSTPDDLELKFNIAQELARKLVEENVIHLREDNYQHQKEYSASFYIGSGDEDYYIRRKQKFRIQDEYFSETQIEEAIKSHFPERFL